METELVFNIPPRILHVFKCFFFMKASKFELRTLYTYNSIQIVEHELDQNFLKRFITISKESEMLMFLARNILFGSIPL